MRRLIPVKAPPLAAAALIAAALGWGEVEPGAEAQEAAPMSVSMFPRGAQSGILRARPLPNAEIARPEPGLHWLDVGADRPPALFVPSDADAGAALPLVVLLHGAGGDALGILPLMQA